MSKEPSLSSEWPGKAISPKTWVWVKIKPGIGPQVLVHVSTCQGKPLWGYQIFDPHPHGESWTCAKNTHLKTSLHEVSSAYQAVEETWKAQTIGGLLAGAPVFSDTTLNDFAWR